MSSNTSFECHTLSMPFRLEMELELDMQQKNPDTKFGNASYQYLHLPLNYITGDTAMFIIFGN